MKQEREERQRKVTKRKTQQIYKIQLLFLMLTLLSNGGKRTKVHIPISSPRTLLMLDCLRCWFSCIFLTRSQKVCEINYLVWLTQTVIKQKTKALSLIGEGKRGGTKKKIKAWKQKISLCTAQIWGCWWAVLWAVFPDPPGRGFLSRNA